MKFVRSCNTGLYKVERAMAITSFIMMIGIMFVQVFFRYVIHTSLSWSEETMRFLFIFTTFFGAACCTYEHKHVVIDFLGTIVQHAFKKEKTQNIIFDSVGIFVGVVCTIFFVYMGNVMFRYSLTLRAQDSLSSAMQMPQWWLGFAITTALFCCAIHFFCEIFISASQLIQTIKGGKE